VQGNIGSLIGRDALMLDAFARCQPVSIPARPDFNHQSQEAKMNSFIRLAAERDKENRFNIVVRRCRIGRIKWKIPTYTFIDGLVGTL